MIDGVHLKAYSEYSLLYSAARIKDLAAETVHCGMSVLGVMDIGMHGAVTVYHTLREAGIKPILGQTLALADAASTPPTRHNVARAAHSLGVLAMTTQGYTSLCELATESAHHAEDRVVSYAQVQAHATGLLCMTGGLDGALAHVLRTEGADAAVRWIEPLRDAFGADRVYVELERVGSPDEVPLLDALLDVARKSRVRTVAVAPIRYVQRDDVRVIDVLAGISQGVSLHEAAMARTPGTSAHFRSIPELRQLFADYPDALEATAEIAEMASMALPLTGLQLPRFPVPDGWTEAGWLRHVAEQGLSERVGADRRYQERLAQELAVIETMDFAGYFLIVHDFMSFAHREGISTGPGRGSAAGSLVAYALRITDVDPLAYGLLFERFLNPERVSWPDIDIDFETDRRYEVISYVAAKYGADRVAQIGTFGTFAARAAIRDVGRVLQTPPPQIDELAKLIPASPGVTLAGAYAQEAGVRTLLTASPALTRIWEMALRIEGLPRHASIHAAGVVIGHQSLTEMVPLMRGAEDLAVTQYPMEDVEALGLLKMDFLGLRTLTICDRAVRYIERVRGTRISYEEMHMDDRTCALLAEGDTDGCFQLESSGVKQVLREMQPRTLEDLIAVISLYRPGPMEQIGAFLRARRGEVPIDYEVPELEPILAPTYGILVYQEQIMQIAATMAGFSLGQADVLRRAVGKKKREVLDETRASFVAGCASRGHAHDVAERVYDLIVRFADYGFNKSHAAAYAVLALRTAYLKANYRAEFMASLMTDTVSRPDKLAQYTLSCRRASVPVLPPDISRSDGDCLPEQLADGRVGVRLGFYAIKNVGTAAVQDIMTQRDAQGPFTSFADVVQRLATRSVTRRVLENLVQVGAMDGLGMSRTACLQQLGHMVKGTKDKKSQERQLTLLADAPDAVDMAAHIVPKDSVDEEADIEAWEQELIGFVVSRDPYASVRQVQEDLRIDTLQNVLEKGKGTLHCAGRVASIRTVQTKQGETMAFLTLEDATARIDVVVFPTIYRMLPDLPARGAILEVKARFDARNPKAWIASSIQEKANTPVAGLTSHEVFLRIDEEMERSPERLRALRETLLAHPGNSPVILRYASGKTRMLDAVRVDVNPKFLHSVEAMLGADHVLVRAVSASGR